MRHVTSSPVLRWSLMLLVAINVTLSSCDKTPELAGETFSEVVETAGIPETPATFEVVDTTVSSNPQQVINDDIWSCKNYTVDLSQNAEEFVLYSASNAEDIYPGNFLQGKFVEEGNPRIIPLKRRGATITINTLNGSNQISASVDEVKYSSIQSATNALIGSNDGNLTANIAYSREEVRSEEEMGVKMNANYSNLTSSVKGSFDFNKSQAFSSVLVKLTQVFYTIVADIPDPDSAFDASVTKEDLEKYVYAGNPATYISSVSYGRVFYLLVQSTESAQAIKAALDVSINAGLVSAGGGFDISKVESLEQVTVTGFAYGGDAAMAAGAVIGKMSDVNTYIKNGGSINNGAPISYQVRSLNDPSIVVKANLATSYTVEECTNITGGIPTFTDTRQSVGAAWFNVESQRFKMILLDGQINDFVLINGLSEVVGPYGLWEYSDNHTHPFRHTGVSAALNIRHDAIPEKTYFFNEDGTKFCAYTPSINSFGEPVDLYKWGTDGSCPFDSIGAAMDLSVGTREIACLINKAGTHYTLFESGNFSTPRSISDLQIRGRDEPVAIPFASVGAALRLYITDANEDPIARDIVAIFNEEGKQYVYWDLDNNVVVGPLQL